MSKPITFLAQIAPMQSAIKLGDDGMRVTLDIPESEIENAKPLIDLRKKVLAVAICEDKSTTPTNIRKSKRERLINDGDPV